MFRDVPAAPLAGPRIATVGRLTWLQVLRFAAALLVVLHHTTSLFVPLPFNMGLYGVLLFFTISGYVITGLLDSNPIHFLAHRFLRIYPAYVGSLVFAALVLGTMHVVPFKDMTLKWSMTLLPLGGDLSEWSRVPYWTLIYEVLFYAIIFLFICIGRKFFNLFLVFWTVVIVFRNLFFRFHDPLYDVVSDHLLTVFTSQHNICFIFGAALQRIHRSGSTWPAALALIAVFAPEYWVGRESATLGVFFAALVHISVMAERYVKAPLALTWIGDRSYGLYLAHNPGYAFMLALPIGGLPLPLMLTVSTVGSLLFGIAYGHLEYSFYVWAKRKFDRRRANRPLVQPSLEATSSSRV